MLGRFPPRVSEGALFLPPEVAAVSARQMWANNRFWMETQNLMTRRYGGRSHQRWYALYFMMRVFAALLRLTGQFERGRRNAWDIAVRELTLPLARLPAAFEGFTILHLADLHLDGMSGLDQRIVERVGGREVDLCVLTGDYRTELHGPIQPTLTRLEELVRGIRSREGFLAVLGNHDDCHMVAPMEAMGIRMLINEQVDLRRDGERLRVIGVDDVHYYYTDQALHALESAGDSCSILLVHSPELFDAAARHGVALYLTGHTHGGQVCLPGGHAILTHLRRGRRFYRGRWSHQGMLGVTNCGAGTSGIPVRFNTRGEILLLRLTRASG
jgi:predicted MPP superfamily phosphohydrolase